MIAENTKSNLNPHPNLDTDTIPTCHPNLALTLIPKVYRSVFEYIEESEEGGIQRYRDVIGRLCAVLPSGKAPLQATLTLTLALTLAHTLIPNPEP